MLLSSVYFNYYLYQENEEFKVSKGAEYQRTVGLALFNLKGDDVELWIEELQEKESFMRLGSYLGELERYSGEFHRMNGKISVVGMALDAMRKHYYDLADRIKNGEGFQEQKEAIQKHRSFIIDTLEYIENQLEDRHTKVWYKKISNHDSKISEDVWGKFKEFESDYLLK